MVWKSIQSKGHDKKVAFAKDIATSTGSHSQDYCNARVCTSYRERLSSFKTKRKHGRQRGKGVKEKGRSAR